MRRKKQPPEKAHFPFVLIAVLIAFFILSLIFSLRGYGYMGYYRGCGQGPSILYWGEPTWFCNKSLRNGSSGGPSGRGGGYGSGK